MLFSHDKYGRLVSTHPYLYRNDAGEWRMVGTWYKNMETYADVPYSEVWTSDLAEWEWDLLYNH